MFSFPGKVYPLGIATTLYEDLKESALVVTAKVVTKKTDKAFQHFDLKVESTLYGLPGSTIVSVITAGGKLDRKGNLAMAVTVVGSVGYEVGEEVLVFLKDAPRNYSLKKDAYLTIRKVNMEALHDRQRFLCEVRSLVETLDIVDRQRRESIFLDLLSSRHGLIVESAVKELGNMKSNQAADRIEQLLHVGDDQIRFQAVNALREIGNEAAASAISTALEDDSPRVRARAASSLGWMRAVAEEEKLLEMFLAKDEEENVKINAVLALANMGSTKAIPALEDALGDAKTSRTLRKSIEQALQKLR